MDYKNVIKELLNGECFNNKIKHLSTKLNNIIYLTLDNNVLMADYTAELNLNLLTEEELYSLYKEIKSLWTPLDREQFFYISENGTIVDSEYFEDSFFYDKIIEIGNYFKTEEEAEVVAKKLKNIKINNMI